MKKILTVLFTLATIAAYGQTHVRATFASGSTITPLDTAATPAGIVLANNIPLMSIADSANYVTPYWLSLNYIKNGVDANGFGFIYDSIDGSVGMYSPSYNIGINELGVFINGLVPSLTNSDNIVTMHDGVYIHTGPSIESIVGGIPDIAKNDTDVSNNYNINGAVASISSLPVNYADTIGNAHVVQGLVCLGVDTMFEFMVVGKGVAHPTPPHTYAGTTLVKRFNYNGGAPNSWTTTDTVYISDSVARGNWEIGYFNGVLTYFIDSQSGGQDQVFETYSLDKGQTFSPLTKMNMSGMLDTFLVPTGHITKIGHKYVSVFYSNNLLGVQLMKSTDMINWTPFSIITSNTGGSRYDETDVIELDSNRVIALSRDDTSTSEPYQQFVSSDTANTWINKGLCSSMKIPNAGTKGVSPALAYDSTRNRVISVSSLRTAGDLRIDLAYIFINKPTTIFNTPSAWTYRGSVHRIVNNELTPDCYPSICQVNDSSFVGVSTDNWDINSTTTIYNNYEFEINYRSTVLGNQNTIVCGGCTLKHNIISGYDDYVNEPLYLTFDTSTGQVGTNGILGYGFPIKPNPAGTNSPFDIMINNGYGSAYLGFHLGTGFTITNPTSLPPTINAVGSFSPTLTSGDIFVGNSSNVATGVAMSGDITISNTGATTIGANKVTYAKIQNETTLTLLGNPTGSGAVPSEITLGNGILFSGSSIILDSAKYVPRPDSNIKNGYVTPYYVATNSPVTSVSNSDNTLTITPTTGAVVAKVNIAHNMNWSTSQTFGNGIVCTTGVCDFTTSQVSTIQDQSSAVNGNLDFTSLHGVVAKKIATDWQAGFQVVQTPAKTIGNVFDVANGTDTLEKMDAATGNEILSHTLYLPNVAASTNASDSLAVFHNGKIVKTGKQYTYSGTATLSSGTVTVSNSNIITGTPIYGLSYQLISGSAGHLYSGSIINNTSFVISSDNAGDNSIVNWAFTISY